MAARNFRQTQAAATLGTIQACAASALSSTPYARLCVEGGVAGVTGLTPSVRGQRAAIMFEMAPGQVGWSAGTWTVPINITGANSNVTLKAVYVCRRTSGGSAVGTVGSNTGLSTALSSTGVISPTVTGVLSTGAASDVVYIVVEFTTPGTNQTFTFLPNQTILTPILEPASFSGSGRAGEMTASGVFAPVARFVGSARVGSPRADGSAVFATVARGTILHPNNARVVILK